MLPHHHLAVSLGIGAGVWVLTGEPLALPTAVATGFLVDGDHFPEYITALVLRRRPRWVLFAHAWEWVALGLVLTAWAGWHPLALSAWLGLFSHLALDQVRNQDTPPLFYFLVWRARHRFLPPGKEPDPTRMAERLARVPVLGPLLLWGFGQARRLRRPETGREPAEAGRRARFP